MIKLNFCLVRLPHLTRDEFLDYWINKHAPLVHSVQSTLRIKRYVQMHSAPDAANSDLQRGRGGPPGFDGVAELWWDDWADLEAQAKDPAAKPANILLLEDEKKFIDLSRSPIWWGEERTIFG